MAEKSRSSSGFTPPSKAFFRRFISKAELLVMNVETMQQFNHKSRAMHYKACAIRNDSRAIFVEFSK